MPPETVAIREVTAALLRDRDAAKYLGRSVAWIRKLRAVDTKAGKAGEPFIGPAWVQIHHSVFYRKESLDSWIAANAVERGTVVYPKEKK